MKSDLIIIIAGRILQIAIMLISIRVLTSILSAEEVGNYYLILSLLSFINLTFLNPPGMYFFRHLLEWQRVGHLTNALVPFLFLMLATAITAVVIFSIIYYSFDYHSKFPLSLLLIYTIPAIFISTLFRNVIYGFNTLGQRKAFVIYNITSLLIGLLLSTLLASQYKNALSWLFGIVIAEAIILLCTYQSFLRGQKLDVKLLHAAITSNRLKKIARFTLPIALTTLMMWGQTNAYRLIVDTYYSAELLGFIAIGLSVASAIFGAVENIAMQFFSPIFLRNILDASKEERAAAWNEIANIIIPIYILVLMFSIATSEILVSILIDEKFHSAYVYTMFGAGIEFFRVTCNVLYKVSQSEHKTSYTAMPYFVGSFMTIASLMYFDFSSMTYMIPAVMVGSFFVIFLYLHFNMNRLLPLDYGAGIIKAVILSLPFFLVLLLDIRNLDPIEKIIIIGLTGIYLLVVTWFDIVRHSVRRII